MAADYLCGDVLHGFRVTRIRPVLEQRGTLYEFLHEKSGMQAMWLQTEDSNKLFSIAFKTLPEDDTGVFHILEHSVLCGSKRFPVREPFLELMKSSMNTFLNAMTFPDKTVYPVASRNDQDLYNLVSVYLDAVFAPSIYDNPNIFYQEGWHYDIQDAAEQPSYQGVVYNEMRGAESAIDSLIQRQSMRMLFPDTCYRYVSGGDSQSIPDLTYEQFLAQHRKYYHPSNAILYLEGNLDLEAMLKLVSEYIACSDSQEPFQIGMQNPTETEELTCAYAIDEEDEESGRCHMVFSKIVCGWEEKEKLHAGMLLASFLADSMEAPLKLAILEQGLGQDVRVWIQDGIAQPCLFVWVCNTDPENREQIEHTIAAIVQQVLAEGIDKETLQAILNQMEFQYAQPIEPRGLNHNMMALSAALYGGDPMTYLTYAETFRFLHQQLSTDYYEKLLAELFCLNGRKTLFLQPSKTLRAQMRNAEAQKLMAQKAAWSGDELGRIIRQNQELAQWQETADTPEQLATIPKLSVSDVAELPEKIETMVTEVDGIQVLLHPGDAENVVYLNLYFAVEEEDLTRLSALTYLPNLLGGLPTANRGVGELYQDIQKNLGSISFELVTVSHPGELDRCQIYFLTRCSVLRSKLTEAVRLLRELLLETDFTQEQPLYFALMQFLEGVRQDVISNGHSYAMRLSSSGFSAENAVKEALEGISSYRYLQQLCQNFEAEKDDLIQLMRDAQREIFCQSRMTISVTGCNVQDIPVRDFISAFPAGGTKAEPLTIAPKDMEESFLSIPADVSYAAMSTNLYALGAAVSGKWKVVSKLLSLRNLWNQIRVQGGAYGAGMRVSDSGDLTCYSYRDPAPENSLACFRQLAAYIREFCDDDERLEPYLISTISDQEPVLTPQAKSEWADMDHLRGISYEARCAQRREILTLRKEDLLECAQVLEHMADRYRTCVVGPETE